MATLLKILFLFLFFYINQNPLLTIVLIYWWKWKKHHVGTQMDKVIGDFGQLKHQRTRDALVMWGGSTYNVIWLGCLKNMAEKMDFPDQDLLSHSCIINLMAHTEVAIFVLDNYSNLTGTRHNPFLACLQQVIGITFWAMFVTIRILFRNFTMTQSLTSNDVR